MSEFDRNADFNQSTNTFMKEEPQLVDMCHNANLIKSESEYHVDIDCDSEDKQLDVKEEDRSTIQQNLSVTRSGFEEEKWETHDSQKYGDTKFDISAKCDCYHKDLDASFDFKPDLDFLVKTEVDDNVYSNKTGRHLLGNTHFTTVADSEKLKCQCKEENNQIKEENTLIVIQSSCLAKDANIGIKSITTKDQNTGTEMEESSCNYHLLLIQENLSHIVKKDEDYLTDNNQGITLMSTNQKFGAKQDLLSESSSSGHSSYAQSHTEDQYMKNRQSCEATLQCSECSKMFVQKSNLTKFENMHKGLTQFRCLDCLTGKSTLKLLKNPVKRLKPFQCLECFKCFTMKSSLKIHENIHKALKPFQCLECSKCFTRKSHLTEHESMHKGLKPFQCLECSKCFTLKSNFTRHESMHKGSKPFQCLECSKCFTLKSHLTRHESIHKGSKPFQCLECSKCFTRKSHLTEHENMHKGLKPFQCLTCSKCFTLKSHLTRHESIHKGSKPFQCLECSKCFTDKSTLRRHEKTHKGLKPFQCVECSKCFTRKSHLTKHENIHTGLKL